MLSHNESVSLLTLPADNGTWGVGITTSSRDRALRELRHLPCWEAAIRCYPATAGWIDAEPITGISVMAGIEDRRRELVIDSAPVVTGLVAVGDAWASTNPSLGRGASIGALHACVLRDVVAKEGTDDPDTLVLRFAAETAATVAPYLDSTLSFDRHRLAEIEADAAGVPYEPEDPAWAMTRALGAGARTDPVVARALAAIASVQALPAEVLGDPAVLGHAAAFLGRPHYAPGASRAELLAAVRGAAGSR
jgi:2-polyprenyl-6-methoxyphenol hydroxylase-like FAD-dependent oxidoreductase